MGKSELNLFVADRIDKIGNELKTVFDLDMDKLTLIARDQNNDEMIICVTNESQDGLVKACELAISNEPS